MVQRINQQDISNAAFDLVKDAMKPYFGDETQEIIYKEFLDFKYQIDILLMQFSNYDTVLNKENLLKEAYLTIMHFREKITNETVFYRIYVQNEVDGKIKMIPYDLTTEQILHNTKFKKGKRGDELIINLTKTAIKTDNLIRNQYYEQLFQRHYDAILSNMKLVKLKQGGTQYRMSKEGMIRYENPENRNLRVKKMTKAGRPSKRYAYFNRGHLAEALDETIYELYFKQKQTAISNEIFLRHYFGTFLKYDNVAGFRGGDVGVTQIKKDNARLMRAGTIIEYLTDIQKTINTFLSTRNSEELGENLIRLFTDESKFESGVKDSIAATSQLIADVVNKFDNSKKF